jgi:Flp pilus assembly protein TadD
MAALVALVLMLAPVLAEAKMGPAATRAMNAGKEHLRRDEYDLAVQSFTKFVGLAPADKLAHDLRASTYLRMENLDLALKDIAKSQKVDADEQTGYFANWLSGIVLLHQGNIAGADSALAIAAKGSPSVAGLRIARARQYADSIVGGVQDSIGMTALPYGQKLAELLLDECIDVQLLGE